MVLANHPLSTLPAVFEFRASHLPISTSQSSTRSVSFASLTLGLCAAVRRSEHGVVPQPLIEHRIVLSPLTLYSIVVLVQPAHISWSIVQNRTILDTNHEETIKSRPNHALHSALEYSSRETLRKDGTLLLKQSTQFEKTEKNSETGRK